MECSIMSTQPTGIFQKKKIALIGLKPFTYQEQKNSIAQKKLQSKDVYFN